VPGDDGLFLTVIGQAPAMAGTLSEIGSKESVVALFGILDDQIAFGMPVTNEH
jgi:hypothetical protein